MSSNNEQELIGSLLALFIFASAIVLALTATIFIIPGVIVGGLCWWAYTAWRDSPERKEADARRHTLQLYDDTLKLYEEIEVTWDLPGPFIPIANELIDQEVGRGAVPVPPVKCNSIEGARYRDRLAKLGAVTQGQVNEATETIQYAIGELHYPDLPNDTTIPLRYLFGDLPKRVYYLISTFFRREGFFALRRRLDKNMEDAGCYPDDYKKDDLLDAFLRGTPLRDLFEVEVPFGIEKEKYFQHGLIAAGTGAGKSQLVSWFIKNEFENLRDGLVSVIVLDSQRELIDSLLHLDLPADRVVHIDPNDIEYPVSIPLFDLGLARASSYEAADRERVVNSAIETLTFVVDSILGAQMTSKQGTLFNFLIRLLIQIPGATLHTMREILQPKGHLPYQKYVDQLSPTAQAFFATEYPDDKQYGETRRQVVRRLFDILEVGVFDRMFSNPESKFDLFDEMNRGKLILLDTDKSLLKDSGTELLGRLYLSMLNIAVQERALIKGRMPVYLFVDESADYVKSNSDTTITTMLEQARKMNVGTFWCVQQLSQFDPGMQASFMANTSIKMCSGVSHADATKLSKEMRTSVEFINAQPALTFATYIKGETGTAVPMKIPYGALKALPQRTEEGLRALKQEMRDRYASKCTPSEGRADQQSGDAVPEPGPTGETDPAPKGETEGSETL